jgi:hypothetical protein
MMMYSMGVGLWMTALDLGGDGGGGGGRWEAGERGGVSSVVRAAMGE